MQHLDPTLHQKQGDYEGAMVLFEECRAGRAEVLSVKHPDYLITLNGMASVKADQGDCDGAMVLYEECKTGRAEVLGVKHPYYLATLNNIANVKADQGDYEGAMVLYEECKAGQAEIKHPDYLGTLNNMANIKADQGDYEGAMELYEECKAGQAEMLGVNHPDYLGTLNNIANVKHRQGDRDGAMVLYKQCKAGIVKHSSYLASLSDMTVVKQKQFGPVLSYRYEPVLYGSGLAAQLILSSRDVRTATQLMQEEGPAAAGSPKPDDGDWTQLEHDCAPLLQKEGSAAAGRWIMDENGDPVNAGPKPRRCAVQ